MLGAWWRQLATDLAAGAFYLSKRSGRRGNRPSEPPSEIVVRAWAPKVSHRHCGDRPLIARAAAAARGLLAFDQSCSAQSLEVAANTVYVEAGDPRELLGAGW
jgi:hypothetical protein